MDEPQQDPSHQEQPQQDPRPSYAGAIPSAREVETPSGRRHVTPVQVRFNDTDMFGHVNNAVYATWVEIARIAFMRGLTPPSGDLILARIELDFVRQIHFGRPVVVHTGVSRIGRTSVTLDQQVLVEGEPAARVGSVVVLYDYAEGRSRPVSDAYRAALEPYLVVGG